MTRVCVFGGARSGTDPQYQLAATDLGKAIARRGFTLVYGGGKDGLMGSVAQSALEHGAEVTGIIPEFLAREDVLHPGLTNTIVLDDLSQQKAKMIASTDAFIALPGGIGTLNELLEVMALGQLQHIYRPIGVLDVASYFEPWFVAFNHAVKQAFIDSADVERLVRSANADELLDRMQLASSANPS